MLQSAPQILVSDAPTSTISEPTHRLLDEHGLAAVTKFLESDISRIEHHEELEYKYNAWFATIIVALMTAATTLITSNNHAHRFFTSAIYFAGTIVAGMAIGMHIGLMKYIDRLIERRNKFEDLIGKNMPKEVGEILSLVKGANTKEPPSRLLRGWFRLLFILLGLICVLLGCEGLRI
jgi:hypothetical protein